MKLWHFLDGDKMSDKYPRFIQMKLYNPKSKEIKNLNRKWKFYAHIHGNKTPKEKTYFVYNFI